MGTARVKYLEDIKTNKKIRVDDIATSINMVKSILDFHDSDVYGNNLTEAFNKVTEDISYVYVPKGVWDVDSPYIVPFFGEGVINYNGNSFINNNIPQSISHTQVEVDGRHTNLSNMSIGQNAYSSNNPNSYANTFVGTSSGEDIKNTVTRHTGLGYASLRQVKKGYSNIAVGNQTMKLSAYADRNTAVGDNSLLNVGNDSPETTHGFFNGKATNSFSKWDKEYPEWRAKYMNEDGTSKLRGTEDTYTKFATHNVGIGRNSLGFSILPKDCVGVGYDSLTCALAPNNSTAIGDRASQNTIESEDSVSIGGKSAWGSSYAYRATMVGARSASHAHKVSESEVIGYSACSSSSYIVTSVVIGTRALSKATGVVRDSVIIGERALLESSNSDRNTVIGTLAIPFLKSGNSNTVIGWQAGRLDRDGKYVNNLTNATCIGAASLSIGDDSVVLGNKRTRVFVEGSVMKYADSNEWSSQRDLLLGLNFLNKIKPTQYRDKNTNGRNSGIFPAIDGRELIKVIKETGLDYPLAIDHSLESNGSNVVTVGYDYFIPILINAVNELSKKLETYQLNEVKND